MRNPFEGYGTRVGGNRFIGRTRLRELLTERLATGAGSVSLVGLPRVGKTSLVATVLEAVSSANPQAIVVRLNLGALPRSGAAIFTRILDDILETVGALDQSVVQGIASLPAVAGVDDQAAWKRLQRTLKHLRRLGWTTVVALDEFDAVKVVPDATTFIQLLRELVDQRSITGFCAVFASRRSLYALETQISGISTLHGVCEHQHVRPLEHEELTSLVARAPVELGPQEVLVPDVWRLTGGHPWLSEMVLCHAADTGSLDAGWHSCRAEFFEFYDHIRSLLGEDDLFRPLLQLAVGPQWDVPLRAPERLRAYGVIRAEPMAGTGDESWRGWSEHFQDYLDRSSREAPVWDLWSRVEQALRDMVEASLEARDGADWLNRFERSHRYAEVVTRWGQLRDRDRRQFGALAVDRLLDYAYPEEITAMIFKEWALFEPVLRRDKAYWDGRFKTLCLFRNPQAHNRRVPGAVVTQAKGYCEEILERIAAGTVPP